MAASGSRSWTATSRSVIRKDLHGPVLACTSLEWAALAFLGGVLDGESNLAWSDHTNESVAGHPGPGPGGTSVPPEGAPDALLRAGCLVP